MAYLKEAILITQEAVDATPQDHPHRAGILGNLRDQLGKRYSKTEAVADLEEAIQIRREAVDATPKDNLFLFSPGMREYCVDRDIAAGRLVKDGLAVGFALQEAYKRYTRGSRAISWQVRLELLVRHIDASIAI